MKRTYADLHVCTNARDAGQCDRMLKRASELGFRLIGIPTPAALFTEETDRLRRKGKEFGLDIAIRLDLRVASAAELTRCLRRFRRRFELIAVICDSKVVARQAAKDRRVDLLNFPGSYSRSRFFDLSEAELASTAAAGLEIDTKPLLVSEGSVRASLLASLRREVKIAKSFRVPVVISSGASEVALMKEPKALVALSSLYDFDRSSAICAVSTNPAAILRRNKEKLRSRYVSPGISIVKQGREC